MDKQLKNTVDFINNKVGNKTGFSVPKNYFKEMEGDFFSSKTTVQLSKENTFKTPTNYFDTVEYNILAKLQLKTPKEVKIVSLYKKILKFIPIAAAASVLLFIGLNYFNINNKDRFNTITQADVASWYEDGYGNTDNNELAIALEASDFEENILPSIEDENLEDYLNTIDSTTILNEIQ